MGPVGLVAALGQIGDAGRRIAVAGAGLEQVGQRIALVAGNAHRRQGRSARWTGAQVAASIICNNCAADGPGACRRLRATECRLPISACTSVARSALRLPRGSACRGWGDVARDCGARSQASEQAQSHQAAQRALQ